MAAMSSVLKVYFYCFLICLLHSDLIIFRRKQIASSQSYSQRFLKLNFLFHNGNQHFFVLGTKNSHKSSFNAVI